VKKKPKKTLTKAPKLNFLEILQNFGKLKQNPKIPKTWKTGKTISTNLEISKKPKN